MRFECRMKDRFSPETTRRVISGIAVGAMSFAAVNALAEPLMSMLAPGFDRFSRHILMEVAAYVLGAALGIAVIWYVLMTSRRLLLSIVASGSPAILVTGIVLIENPSSDRWIKVCLLMVTLTIIAVALFWAACAGLERMRK